MPRTTLKTLTVTSTCQDCDWVHYSRKLHNGSSTAIKHARTYGHSVELIRVSRRLIDWRPQPLTKGNP
jgi:hypothetical protein